MRGDRDRFFAFADDLSGDGYALMELSFWGARRRETRGLFKASSRRR